jgi:flagella basal body P-ring formation protein FlgA
MMRAAWFALFAALAAAVPCWAGAQQITEQDLRRALAGYVREHGPAGTQLVGWQAARGVSLPMPGRIVAVDKDPSEDWGPRTTLCVRAETGPGKTDSIWVIAQLKFVRTVVVACRNLPIGHRIASGDVRTEVREGAGRDGEYSELEEVVGKEIYRPVSQNACLKHMHIREGRNPGSGDPVIIVAQKEGLRIEAPGRLLEAGKEGDRVRVLNVATGTEVYATIVDRNTVTVSF